MNPTVRTAWAATALFAGIQAAATVAPDGPAAVVSVIWSLGAFAVGSAVFLWAFFIAADRSRDEPVTVAGVVWLIGSAPAGVARSLRWALVAQVVIAVVAASVRPFSPVAFGVLVPMVGLGSLAWFGARHGVFTPAGATGPSPVSTPEPVRSEPEAVDRSDPDDFDQLFRRRRKRRPDGSGN